MISRFEAAQKEKKISISFGYAYTDDIGKTSYKNLLDEADRKMYAHKEQMHRQR
jgi:GGDEF domain-containing protein